MQVQAQNLLNIYNNYTKQKNYLFKDITKHENNIKYLLKNNIKD